MNDNPINPYAERQLNDIYTICERIKPRVVTVCLTYNHEPYIRKALDGFVMQKTDFPFVAIIHDDASTDGTAEIIREYAEKYPDIILPIYEKENQYSKKDGSLTRISRKAMLTTGADYIAMCEGDDYWTDPLKLQKQVDFLEAHDDYVLTGHNSLILFEEFGISKPFNKNIRSGELSYEQIVNKWLVPTASIVVRRRVYDSDDGKIARIYSGDYRLLLMSRLEGRIFYFNDIMSVYRYNTSADSNSASARFKNRQLFVMQEKLRLLNSIEPLADGKFQQVINRRIRELNKDIRFFEARQKNDFPEMLNSPGNLTKFLFNRLRGCLFRLKMKLSQALSR
ncbi:MAG: glycosyltransferase [Lachnospiraceae bacterium]|nr:glycosyltransferase [Lachnospiraceae bacterium]